MIKFEVLERGGECRVIEVPDDMNLTLMEVLRASDYPIAATCGGMALCATCYVEVVGGSEQLDGPHDVELDMLDTLPSATPQSRLACQVRITGRLHDAVIKLNDNDR